MMRLMIVTYARKIRYYLIGLRTEMDTKNTRVAQKYVLIAQVSINVRKVKIM